jgi:hypothetical protein
MTTKIMNVMLTGAALAMLAAVPALAQSAPILIANALAANALAANALSTNSAGALGRGRTSAALSASHTTNGVAIVAAASVWR